MDIVSNTFIGKCSVNCDGIFLEHGVNIRKTLQYLLAGNTGELLLMTIAVIAGFPSPLLPIHLLWINLVTDGLPALCLAADPIDPDVMTGKPRPREEQITNGSSRRISS